MTKQTTTVVIGSLWINYMYTHNTVTVLFLRVLSSPNLRSFIHGKFTPVLFLYMVNLHQYFFFFFDFFFFIHGKFTPVFYTQ